MVKNLIYEDKNKSSRKLIKTQEWHNGYKFKKICKRENHFKFFELTPLTSFPLFFKSGIFLSGNQFTKFIVIFALAYFQRLSKSISEWAKINEHTKEKARNFTFEKFTFEKFLQHSFLLNSSKNVSDILSLNWVILLVHHVFLSYGLFAIKRR